MLSCTRSFYEARPGVLDGRPDGTVANVLSTRFIAVFGCPAEFRIDQGRNFESKLFQQCKVFDVMKTRTTLYNPKSDDLCERWYHVTDAEDLV